MSTYIFNKSFDFQKLPRSSKELKSYTLNNDSPEKLILIVPTGKQKRFYSFSYINDYFNKYKKPVNNLKVFTFEEFVNFTFEKCFPSEKYKIISSNYQFSIIEDILQKYELKFYKKTVVNYSIIRKITDTILSLKSEGFSVNELQNEIKKSNNKSSKNIVKEHEDGVITNLDKFSDLVDIYSAYNSELKDGILDKYDQLIKIANVANSEKINSAYSDNIDDDTIIMVDGFSEFKEPEIKFLQLFNNVRYPFIVIFNNISFNNTNYNKLLSGNISRSKGKLIDHKFKIIEKKHNNLRKKTDKKRDIINFFKKNLFVIDFNVDDKIDLKDLITLVEVNSKHEEVAKIAKLIKYLNLVENIELNKIIISSRNSESYSELFREIFEKEEIPINISERYSLANSNVIILLLNLFELTFINYNTNLLRKVLNNSILKRSDLIEPLDEKNIFQCIDKLKLKNIYGFENLIKKLKVKRNFLVKLIKEDKLDESEKNFIFKEIDKFKLAIKDLNLFYNYFEKKSIKVSINSFNKKFINLIDKYKFLDLIRAEELDVEKYDKYLEKDTRAIRTFLTTLDEFVLITTKLNKNPEFEIKVLFKKFKSIISETKYQIRELFDHGVTFTAIEQTRGIDKQVSILCGAVDGEFPIKFKTDKFLGKALKSSEYIHNCSERQLFYQFLSNGESFYNSFDKDKKKIYIFYPNSKDKNDMLRSPYIDSLLNISDIKMIDKLNSPWFNQITNEEELQSYYSRINHKNVDNKYEDLISYRNLLIDVKTGKLDKNQIDSNSLSKIEKIDEKIFSVTSFEKYAKNPYEYFINYIIRLNQEDEVDTYLNSMDKGNILHKILYSFYMAVQLDQMLLNSSIEIGSPINTDLPKIFPVELEKSKKQDYKKLLKEISNKEVENYKIENPLFDFEIKKIVGDISLVMNNLELEFDKVDKGWGFKPALFEFEFGMNKNSIIPEIELENGVKVKGKIDRVEVRVIDDKLEFLIVDYKLNIKNIKNENEIIKGEAFQFPLYSLALKKIFKEYYKIDSKLISCIYYGLIPKYYKNKFQYMESFMRAESGVKNKLFENYNYIKESGKTSSNELEEIAEENTSSILINIKKGEFPFIDSKNFTFDPNKELKNLVR